MNKENSSRRSYGSSVKQIQNYLRKISYTDSDIPHIKENGIYDDCTSEAVELFQKKYMRELQAELIGRVDNSTWDALRREAAISEELMSPPEKISPFSEKLKDGKLVLGDTGVLVLILHIMLDYMRLAYDELEDTALSSSYDEATKKSVSVIQRSAGLPDTGEVDKATWNIIARLFNSYVKTE